MGRLMEVPAIAARTPGGYRDPEISALAVNALLAMGQIDPACQISDNQAEARAAAYWLQVRAFCLAHAGNIAGAELTAELATNADPSDKHFLRRLGRMTTPPKKSETVSVQKALDLALVEAAKDAPELEDLPIALQFGLINRPRPAQLELLLSTFALGTISEAQLVDQMLAQTSDLLAAPEPDADGNLLSPIEVELMALKHAQAQKGQQKMASLFALGRAANEPAIRAQALAQLPDLAKNWSQWLALHRLVSEELRYLPVQEDFAKFAPIFARASLLVGNTEQARQWIQILPVSSDEPGDFGPALRAIGGRTILDEEQMMARMGGPGKDKKQVLIDLLALTALREPLPAKYRQWVSKQSTLEQNSCDHGQGTALRQSARAGAIAETIFRAADLARNEGSNHLPIQCSALIVEALHSVGLEHEARLLAAEWMLSDQFSR
jgi:hypothetical protein